MANPAEEPTPSAHDDGTPSASPPPSAMSPLARRLILGAAAVMTLVGTVGLAFLPLLAVKNPALLLLTSADGRNIVLASARLELWTVLAIAVPRRMFAMIVTWGLGWLYGRALLGWTGRRLPRLGRALAWFERLFLRYPRTLLVIVPTYTTAVLAGVSRTPWRLAIPWMVVGQVAYVALSFALGDAMSTWVNVAIGWVSAHVWEATAACVAIVAIQQAVAMARRRRATASPIDGA